MFEYLDAHDGIKGFIGLRDGYNIADNIQVSLIPGTRLQSNPVPLAVVLAEILGYVVKMRTKGFESPLACSCVENTGSRRDLLESFLQPGDACGFVMGANGSCVNYS